VLQYVDFLKQNISLFKMSDIVIITPYRKQVEKIRKALGDTHITDITVYTFC